jgi:hypothetical protein
MIAIKVVYLTEIVIHSILEPVLGRPSEKESRIALIPKTR